MKPRDILLALAASATLAACASQSEAMRLPTEQEQRDCEAQGGSIEPAFALNEYVCLLPESATS